MLRRLVILPAVLAILTGGPVAARAIGTAGTAGTVVTWTIEPTSSPVGATQTDLDSVSCTSGSNCMAVGEASLSSGSLSALAEHWDGSTWTVVTTAMFDGRFPGLEQVSCGAATTCMATTTITDTPMTELWNGSTWTLESLARPANSLNFSVEPISCASASTCVAVGCDLDSQRGNLGLAESWNGTAWSVQATLPGACNLGEISCATAASCLAVADTQALAEYWDGRTWTMEPPLQPGGANPELFDVSCPVAKNCTAAGSYANASGMAVTLAEHWNGSTWTIEPTKNKSKSSDDDLDGISCVSASNCTATGTYANATGTVSKTLAEHWNGSTWNIQATPDPPHTTMARLLQVSCPGGGAGCTAVGDYTSTTVSFAALAEVSPA
jgi:hypothetical protein